jgi:hypothetical protein
LIWTKLLRQELYRLPPAATSLAKTDAEKGVLGLQKGTKGDRTSR